MKELMILMVKEIESSVKKTFPFYDMVEMLCFLLGIYGERIFLHIYMCLKKMSPDVFCFMCLICAYLLIAKNKRI